MKGDVKVIEYLNEALRHELTAVNQYWLHYRLLDNWGYKSLAKQWRQELIEEMQHADKLIVASSSSKAVPICRRSVLFTSGQTVKEVLERDLDSEISARSLY